MFTSIRKIYLTAILSCVFTITSCEIDTLPTTPFDRDDNKIWNSALVDANGSAHLIAAIRPDGIPRLYGGKYEYSYNSNGWSKNDIDPNGSSNYLLTAVGKCRNDGILRIYGVLTGTYSGTTSNVSEFNYIDNQWTKQNILTLDHGYRFTIADARNEGYQSLYILDGSGFHEVRYWNGIWKDTLLYSRDQMDIDNICGGDGRGDGKEAVYILDYSTALFELRYESNRWRRSKIGQLMSLPSNVVTGTALSITKSHNGHPNIIAEADSLHEFYFDTDRWIKVGIGTEPGVNQICGGIGHNDGVERIYCAVDFNIMAEYTLDGASWVKTSQRKSSEEYSSMVDIVTGPGRGDGLNRVYVTNNVAGLVEFTFRH